LPTQEDVLAVLASLDPPESYIPDDLREGSADAPRGDTSDWRRLPEQAGQLVVRIIPCAAGVVALLFVNGAVLLIIAASEGLIPWLVTLGGLGWLNYAGVRRFRAWSASHHGNLIDDVRHSLAAWLMPKQGAQAT
jgi:hypothetical protein